MSPSPGHLDSYPPQRSTPEPSSDGSVRVRRPSTPSTTGTPTHAGYHATSSSSPFTSVGAAPVTGSVKAAFSFIKHINLAGTRKPMSTTAAQATIETDGDAAAPQTPTAGADAAANQPVITETEVIQPAAPGSTLGQSLQDDTLDRVVALPSLDRSTVADYAAAAENWLMTDKMLVQYEEFMARGLLMVRNIVRSEPRYAAQASVKWMPVVRESLASKHELIRAAAANTLAAFAVNTPGRDTIQKDPLVLRRLMHMLTSGINAGCDNIDAQYACLALSNIAMNNTCKQPLLRNGMLPHAAEVLRAAIRWFNSLGYATYANSGGGSGSRTGTATATGTGAPPPGSAGGSRETAGHGSGHYGTGNSPGFCRKVAPIMKAATYITTLLTCWAVDAAGRQQLRQHGIPELTAELHERCSGALGEDSPLSRRLALLVEASNAIELLEVIEESAGSMGVNWDLLEDAGARLTSQAAMLHGVSFAETIGRSTRSRASAAMDALNKMVAAEDQTGGGQGQGQGHKPGSPPDAGRMTSDSSRVVRNASRKQSAPVPTDHPAASAGSGGTAPFASAAAAAAAAGTYSAPSTPPTPGLLAAIAAANGSPTSSLRTLGGGGSSPAGFLSPREGMGGSRQRRSLLGSRVPQTTTSFSQSLVGLSSGQVVFNTSGLSISTNPAPLRSSYLSSSNSLSHLHQQHPQQHQHQQQHTSSQVPSPLPSPTSSGGSMLGVHFSASIFQEAAAATAAAATTKRAWQGEEDTNGFGRRSASSCLSPSQSQEKGVRLPAVPSRQSLAAGDSAAFSSAPSTGGRSTASTSTITTRHTNDHQAHGGRLDLPFHLVRPIPTISASSGKVSRISAAYGQMSGPRPSGQGDSLGPQNGYPRTHTAEF